MDPRLQQRLAAVLREREPGPFHFSEIYGAGWDRLYIGDRVKLGNAFLRLVRAGRFADVEDTGEKRAGGRVYRKRAR